MFEVGDKVRCVEKQKFCYVNLGEVCDVLRVNVIDEDFDILVHCDSSINQYASAKNFVKVVE